MQEMFVCLYSLISETCQSYWFIMKSCLYLKAFKHNEDTISQKEHASLVNTEETDFSIGCSRYSKERRTRGCYQERHDFGTS